tara:strand:+ start:310 stop:1932 length:1623 start_codon:yes stop_codon:yes gene_type:complete
MLSLKKNKKYFTFIFFFIFFVLGFYVYPDYGISIDEDNTRIIGLISLKNIFSLFSTNYAIEVDNIIGSQISAHVGFETSGVAFDLPMAFLEFVLNIKESRKYYLLRHFSTFILYFISCYFFFLIIKNRFKSWSLSILGSLFFIASPRIFANSFFNSKDIVFMSFFIIGIYTLINFLNNKNFKNVIFFSLTSALLINLRIFGLILPALFILLYIEHISRSKIIKEKHYLLFFYFIISLIFFIFLTAPNLWDDPFNLFLVTIKNLSEHNLGIYTFYLGEFINTNNPPWHYSLVWIFISTPLLYTFLFLVGFILLLRRTFNNWISVENNDSYFKMWSNNFELQDLIFLGTFLIPLLITTYFGSISYDGWRHLYFIYPSFLLISILGLNFIKNYFFKINYNYIYIIIIILVIPNIFWMIKNHPYQQVYFNYIAHKDFNKNFEMDYMGVTNKNALEFIVSNEKEIVNVYNISSSDLTLAKQIFNKKIQNKINIVGDIDKADYIINNYRDWNAKKSPINFIIPSGFDTIYEIKVDDISINTIYKKQ